MLREKIRWSCGAGLVFLLGIARVELNYCVPFGAQNSDRYQFVNLATSVVSRRPNIYLIYHVYCGNDIIQNCKQHPWKICPCAYQVCCDVISEQQSFSLLTQSICITMQSNLDARQIWQKL